VPSWIFHVYEAFHYEPEKKAHTVRHSKTPVLCPECGKGNLGSSPRCPRCGKKYHKKRCGHHLSNCNKNSQYQLTVQKTRQSLCLPSNFPIHLVEYGLGHHSGLHWRHQTKKVLAITLKVKQPVTNEEAGQKAK